MDIRLIAAQTRLDDERCASSAEEELNGTAAAEQRPSVEMVTQPEDEEENDSPTLLSQLSSELTTTTKSVHHMIGCERFQTVVSLWPYMIPLFFVYMTEYMMVSRFEFYKYLCILEIIYSLHLLT